MKILVTGAAGKVGRAFIEYAKNRFEVRLVDLVNDSKAGISAVDIRDLNECRAACKDMETVVHLAADPSPDADFLGSLLDTNIKGTFNIFRAAKDEGCSRVIFASSAQAVEAYPVDEQVRAQMPVRPKNLYGVSKCFGEALAAYFAYNENLSAIVVRIACFENPDDHKALNARDLSAFISPRDLGQLLVRCIEVKDVDFAIVHGVSENRFKRLDLSETKALLGYQPVDDAFKVFKIPLYD
jgi:nucleoside-diphosphate-sugar epimerase